MIFNSFTNAQISQSWTLLTLLPVHKDAKTEEFARKENANAAMVTQEISVRQNVRDLTCSSLIFIFSITA